MREPQRAIAETPSGLLDLVGQELGASEPRVISQSEIDGFAEVTRDHQWIHVDQERAKSGPFGTTIAHGFLTLSLAPLLLADILEVRNSSMGINYGLDRVRFLKPVPSGSRIQGVATLASAEPIGSSPGLPGAGVQAKAVLTIEFANDGQPCCVAEVLFRYYE